MELLSLSFEYSQALKKQDWEKLEVLSKELLIRMDLNNSSQESDLRKVAKHYLASIVGDGRFLLHADEQGEIRFHRGVKVFDEILTSSKHDLKVTLLREVNWAGLVLLFLSKPQGDTLNKAAKGLRKLGRPHLAIELTSHELAKSRLNYYSLVVRGSAYVDLGIFEKAIADGQLALKHSPTQNRYYALTLLARAKYGLFKKNSEISDGENALKYALESLRINRDPYIARIFIAIVKRLGAEEFEEFAEELQSNLVFEFDGPDPVAVQISESIVHMSDNSIPLELDDFWDSSDLEEDSEWIDSDSEEDSITDYFEDYFEDYAASLNDPQNPHLEP